MHFIITLIRNLLGGIIAFFDFITRGSKQKRHSAEQQQVAVQSQSLTLYQFFACPFCIKTRRAIHKLNLPIAKKDISQGSPFRQELLAGGGRVQAPCLRIDNAGETIWLYESSEIIQYLKSKFE